MNLILWTFVIAIVTSLACSLAGVLLVVKREAFISEGLSHAVLPGVILAFLVFEDRSSPLLIICAALAGLLMVWLVQMLVRTGKVKQDAALGIVFSGMFSVGVILSSLRLKNVHFHAHCIIDGNLAFAALEPFECWGVYLGPRAFISMLLFLVVLIGFIVLFFKQLKLLAFDESSLFMLGGNPRILHGIWLALVAMVVVAAFEIAGTVLVVALMIAPPAAANYFSKQLSTMFYWSAALGVASAIIGVAFSLQLDISPTGAIASSSGMLFLLVALVAPQKGLVAKQRARSKQRKRIVEWLATVADP